MLRPLPTSLYALLLLILVVANISFYRILFAPKVLEVSVLEVGKGDATLVHTPNDKTLLIDAGPDASILRALGEALPMWQRRIDAVVLTSSAKSAVGGLVDVSSRYRVPDPIHFGTVAVPYGTLLTLDDVSISVLYADSFTVSYGSTSLMISSSTPKGVFISDGKEFTK